MADIGWGLGALLIMGVLAFTGAIVATGCGLIPGSVKPAQEPGALAELPAQLLLGWFFGFAVASFGEESLFRGFWQEVAGQRFGAWKGNLVQAALFAAAHLGLEPIDKAGPLLLVRFAFGLFLGWLRIKRGTLLPAGILHGFIG